MSKQYTIEVVRHRASVTQGSVGVDTFVRFLTDVRSCTLLLFRLFCDEWPIGETVCARVKRVLSCDSAESPH